MFNPDLERIFLEQNTFSNQIKKILKIVNFTFSNYSSSLRKTKTRTKIIAGVNILSEATKGIFSKENETIYILIKHVRTYSKEGLKFIQLYK